VKLKNTSGGTVDLPTLDARVPAGDELEVTGDVAQNLLASGLFERTDKPKTSEKE
jgi:hypothetical protein